MPRCVGGSWWVNNRKHLGGRRLAAGGAEVISSTEQLSTMSDLAECVQTLRWPLLQTWQKAEETAALWQLACCSGEQGPVCCRASEYTAAEYCMYRCRAAELHSTLQSAQQIANNNKKWLQLTNYVSVSSGIAASCCGIIINFCSPQFASDLSRRRTANNTSYLELPSWPA